MILDNSATLINKCFGLNMKTIEPWRKVLNEANKMRHKGENFPSFFMSLYVYQQVSPHVALLIKNATENVTINKNEWYKLVLDCLNSMYITGYYINQKKTAMISINKVLFYGGDFKTTIKQMKFYLTKLEVLNKYRFKLPGIYCRHNSRGERGEREEREKAKIYNPSIIKISNEDELCYLVNARTQEYSQQHRKYITYNYVFTCGKDLKPLEIARVLDNYPRKKAASVFQGMEDIRFVLELNPKYTKIKNLRDALDDRWFTCATADSNSKKCPYGDFPSPEVNLVQLDKVQLEFLNETTIVQEKTVGIKKFISLKRFEDTTQPQKNWLGFIRNEEENGGDEEGREE